MFERRTAANGVTWLVCPAFTAPHGFATRRGGVSAPPFDALNLGMSSGDDPDAVAANRARWAEALGFAPPIYTVHQVHGPAVHVLDADEALPPAEHQADALTTALPGRAIGVFTADCAPILMEAVDGTAVAAVHAGWRGTVAGVAREAVRRMAEAHGVPASRLRAAIGPTIGPCCFEVGDEVVAAMRAAGLGDAVVPREPRSHLDLFRANVDQLVAAGLDPANVHASGLCTVCGADDFHSWRRDGARSGRMQAAIARPVPAAP